MSIGNVGFPSRSDKCLVRNEVANLLTGCQGRCERDGDGRYCILFEVFSAVATWREGHNESGGVPRRLLHEIGNRIDAQLPQIFQASLAVGATLAATLRGEVDVLLLSPQEWKIWT